jgi:hypothetical protein
VLTNKAAIDLVQTHANYLWTLVAACLVFFMQAGFAMVEAGFTRAKNAINIMMKNLMDFSIGSIAFWAIGFGLMFGATSPAGSAPPAFFSAISRRTATPGCWPSGCSRWSLPPRPPPSFPAPWRSAPSLRGTSFTA